MPPDMLAMYLGMLAFSGALGSFFCDRLDKIELIKRK